MSLTASLHLATFPVQALAMRALLKLPEPALRKLAGGPRPPLDGQVLAPELELLLAASASAGTPLAHGLTPDAARGLAHVTWRSFNGDTARMERTEDTFIPGGSGLPMALRVFFPPGVQRPSPALLYFHGGGWVLGSIETHDAVARKLAAEAGVVVCLVDYRLAPEHRFPAAVDDCVAAFRWLRQHAGRFGIDPERIAVGGDSAGGNLAAVVCQQQLREALPLPRYQLLIYPALDFRLETRSFQLFSSGYILERADVDWFAAHYFGDQDSRLDPRASPGLAKDLGGLPPAGIVTAGYDVLRDEGADYAERLRSAGVSVHFTCRTDLIHGFANVTGIVPAAHQALTHAAKQLRAGLAVSG